MIDVEQGSIAADAYKTFEDETGVTVEEFMASGKDSDLVDLALRKGTQAGLLEFAGEVVTLVVPAAKGAKVASKTVKMPLSKFKRYLMAGKQYSKYLATGMTGEAITENLQTRKELEAVLGALRKEDGTRYTEAEIAEMITWEELKEPTIQGGAAGGLMSLSMGAASEAIARHKASERAGEIKEKYPELEEVEKIPDAAPQSEYAEQKTAELKKQVDGDIALIDQLSVDEEGTPATEQEEVQETTDKVDEVPAGTPVADKEEVSVERDETWEAQEKESLEESDIESQEELESELKVGQWGMLTGENPNATPATEEENKSFNERAKAWLKKKGYTPQQIFGKYGSAERSFFVRNLSIKDAVDFAREFKQESVATNRGLVYADGTMNPIVAGQKTGVAQNDFYSTIKTKQGNVDFAVQYAFDRTVQLGREELSLKANIQNQVDKALSSVGKLLGMSDSDIIIYDNSDDFFKAIGKKKEEGYIHEGEFTSDGKIHINLEDASLKTVAHEIFHAVLFKAFGTKGDGQTRDIFRASWDMVDALMETLPKTSRLGKIAAKIQQSVDESYSKDFDEETLAELFGAIAEDYETLTKPQQSAIVEWVNKVLKATGLDKIFGTIEKDNEVVEMFQSLAKKVATGEEVQEQEVKDILDKTKRSKEARTPIDETISDAIEKSSKKKVKDSSSVPIFNNQDKLGQKSVLPGGRTKVLHLGEAFDKWAKKNNFHIPLPNWRSKASVSEWAAKALPQISDGMVGDILHQLSKDNSGIGWYDRKTKSALELMSRLHPELAKEEEAHLRFTIMVAAISQNNSVDINFRAANRAYTHYKETGKLPTWSYPGKSTAKIKENIRKVFTLIDEIGWQETKKILQSEKTVKEWKDDIGGSYNEQVTERITGAMAVLGSKIGSFWGNLNGDFSTLTADLWFTRNFNRYTGNVVYDHTEAKDNAGKREVQNNLKSYKGDKFLFGFKKEDIFNDDKVFDKWLNAAEKYYRESGFSDKNDLLIKANTLHKNRTGALQDSPRGGQERALMREAMQMAQDKLEKLGLGKIDIADLQAILWYNEKDLYKEFKAVNQRKGFI
jgi:hypothetical protein